MNYPDNVKQTYTFDHVGNRTNLMKTSSLESENIIAQFNQLNQLNSWSSSLLAGGNIVSLSGKLADANIDYISVNSQTATIDSNTFTINDLQLNPGLNTLKINAQDKAGNSSQVSLDLTLDNTVNAVYGYDSDGNLISNSVNGTTWNYNWNAENKLIKASSSLGKSIDYTYYEDGNLGSKTQSAIHNTQYYVYDGIHCIAKYDQDNNLINEIVYGPQIDEVLCSIDSSDTAHYYHQDALQSVVAITDGFANKSAVYEYDIYGKIKNKTGSFKNEITYTGRWLDEDTGLYFYRARWYDADNGRFISKDPVFNVNLYRYAENTPINWGDPTGANVSFYEIFRFLKWVNDLGGIPRAVVEYLLEAKPLGGYYEWCEFYDQDLVTIEKYRSYKLICKYYCDDSGEFITKTYKLCNDNNNCPYYYQNFIAVDSIKQ